MMCGGNWSDVCVQCLVSVFHLPSYQTMERAAGKHQYYYNIVYPASAISIL